MRKKNEKGTEKNSDDFAFAFNTRYLHIAVGSRFVIDFYFILIRTYQFDLGLS